MLSSCAFLRTHCYKVVVSALALLVALEYGFGVIYEEHRRLNEVYFTFNLTLPPLSTIVQHHNNDNSNSSNGTDTDDPYSYSPTPNMTLVALQSSINSSDPYQLDLLLDPSNRNTSSDDEDALNYTKKPSVCPLVSPLLMGPVNVSKVALAPDELVATLGPLLLPGGRYHPPDCLAHYKVAIIIPYRDREEHLRLFLQNMHPFLQRQQIDYGIFVVEQSGQTPFNRAMLMNIGAAEALRQDAFQCFIFHDVDLIPEDDRNIYSCPEQPRHMSVAIDVFKYQLPYEGLFGGVSAMSTDHFVKVNGFSNLFWGWGGEDDDMSSRIKYNKLIISRYPASIARYKMLKHKKAKPNPNRYRVMRGGAKRSKIDGLTTLKYKRLDLLLNPLYIHIIVDIKPSS